ncbi:Panacea domain-containing protein [Salidesulfovibrio onnuriiensis]|uniref:Panacea domain-containing protein n=1 Tax=Salidesulfovibrio onnuriiensis TaxID=2583823 RepID=UPI0011CAD23C|nr:type II toxin-antitoxin system antitoxin SocA domain-containing protein [Salidesulfovibrio onnuriiensis]
MTTINDACDYIISKLSADDVGLSVLKLQKLLYYCQSWHLAFGQGKLFEGKFQAWVHGPVNREIYDRFKDDKMLYSAVVHEDIRKDFKAESIPEKARQCIDAVLDVYAKYTGDQLEYLTHQELPWKDARGRLELHERCENDISEDTMQQFYAAKLEK